MDESRPGALALVGSGEYTPAMTETDLMLLDTLRGPGAARVMVLPTAAGLEEPASPRRWANMGLEHFKSLGAEVHQAMILNRADATDPGWLSVLEDANFYYFSGGNPAHVVESMQGTPAWEVILRRHLAGAVLAGCSAGAMAFGGWTPSMSGLRSGRLVTLGKALEVVPSLIILPHFDRMGRFVPAGTLNSIAKGAPERAIVVGIDEDTALVRLPATNQWQVSGRQTVSVFDPGAPGGKRVYHAGEIVSLPS